MSLEKEQSNLRRMDPETQERLRQAAEKGLIECAPSDRIKELESYVEKVLEAFGHPEALVTDESTVRDFVGFFMTDEESRVELDQASLKLGIEMRDFRERIFEVAQRLKEN